METWNNFGGLFSTRINQEEAAKKHQKSLLSIKAKASRLFEEFKPTPTKRFNRMRVKMIKKLCKLIVNMRLNRCLPSNPKALDFLASILYFSSSGRVNHCESFSTEVVECLVAITQRQSEISERFLAPSESSNSELNLDYLSEILGWYAFSFLSKLAFWIHRFWNPSVTFFSRNEAYSLNFGNAIAHIKLPLTARR